MRLLLASVLLWGCSDSSAKIRMVPNVVAGVQASLRSDDTETSESRIGSPLAVNLQSLKYYMSTRPI